MTIGEIGEALRRSTVHIRSTHMHRPSTGSGLIWDGTGTIITNAHVLGPGSHVVELWDGRSFPAEVKAKDDQRDLARIELRTTGLAAATFRYAPVNSGELVIAVGNPLGFTGALTTGFVFAAGPVDGLGRRPWVQATIRLAPGNSGGPLADAAGHVVGINTMVVQGGIALAVPSAMVGEFVRNGVRPRIGVTVRPVRLNQRKHWALLILSVEPGSPAERASLQIGDFLTGTSEGAFASAADLSDSIEDAGSGPLRLRFLRGDTARERQVVIALSATREAA
jgi:serine protease Do